MRCVEGGLGLVVWEKRRNEVKGIRKTGIFFNRRCLLVHERCSGLIDELGTYMWDDKAAEHGEERPVKQQDHGPDALRYFVNYLHDSRFE